MSKILFSIAVPTFNEENFLGDCLKSIEKQTLKKNIEVLIIDDNSTDKTLEIAKSFQNKINVRILKNGTKNPEIGKKIALMHAKGDFFMYFDADMRFADANWFEISVKPLIENKNVVGTLARFKPANNQNSLTRYISYDEFQRDSFLAFFTPGIEDVKEKEEKGYILCRFTTEKIPCQSLCLYRTKILKKLFSNIPYLMDNDVPVILVKKGHDLFAYCPQVGVNHFYFSDLKELVKKRLKGVQKTYMNYLDKREYKWINLKKKRNFFLLAGWIVYSHLIVPAAIHGIYKAFKHRDIACLKEPVATLLVTDAMIYGFLKSGGGIKTLSRL